MEKQTIIRGAAIVIAGIAASTYAAQNLLYSSPSQSAGYDASVTAQPTQILGAGLVSGGGQLKIEGQTSGAEMASDAPASEGEDGSPVVMAALSSGNPQSALPAGEDFAPKLARAEAGAETGALGAVQDCTPQLVAAASVDALIELQLTAPCHRNERVVVSHGDLAFSGFTSSEGRFNSYLPALAADAKIDVFLSDDQFLQASVAVESVERHLRVALQWSGDSSFSLHAYHDGAAFGSEGHLNASRPFDPNQDEAFLIALGAAHGLEPMRAEIYSIPAELASIARLEVEMRYSAAQCGRDLSAYVLQTGPGADDDIKELVFAVPECPAQEGSLVMPLPFEAPRHASLNLD